MEPLFMSISDTAKMTGLSQFFLRTGCQNGTIDCLLSGNKYYINVPRLLRQLDADDEIDADQMDKP